MENFNIAAGFHRSVGEHAGRLFYSDAARDVTYAAMGTIVARLAACLSRNGRPRRVGILATRNFEACADILAADFTGATYVPINLKWPESRIAALL